MSKCLVVLSGGLDSTYILLKAIHDAHDVDVIIFDYGQKHRIEIDYAVSICDQLNIPNEKIHIIDLAFYNDIANSKLLSNDKLEAHVLGTMPAAFVPNRNMMFLTIAHSLATKLGIDYVFHGCCCGETTSYPDSRPDFMKALNTTLSLGNRGLENAVIYGPIQNTNKVQLWQNIFDNDWTDFIIKNTLTCYNGDTTMNDYGMGCSECQSCIARRDAYHEACYEARKT